MTHQEMATLDNALQTRYERAKWALAQAEAEYHAARTALHEARKAELARLRALAVKSQQERERRNSAPLGVQTGFQLMR